MSEREGGREGEWKGESERLDLDCGVKSLPTLTLVQRRERGRWMKEPGRMLTVLGAG